MNSLDFAMRHHALKIHFSIRAKIFLIILIPSLLLILVILMDNHYLAMLGRSAELILSKNYKSIQAAQKIRQHLEISRNRVLLNIFKSEEIGVELMNPNQEIDALLDFCRKNITEPGEQPIIDDLFIKYDTYRQLLHIMTQNPTKSLPLRMTFILVPPQAMSHSAGPLGPEADLPPCQPLRWEIETPRLE